MIIGYSAWGFIGDGVIDSPDGGRLTRALFIENIIKDGHTVIWLQQNRDVNEYNEPLFYSIKAMSYKDEQKKTLCNVQYLDEKFPQLDVLFVEWRWPISGRNSGEIKDEKNWTPDLERQTELINYYCNKNTKIIIWDKDEKMTGVDEENILCRKQKVQSNTLVTNRPDVLVLSPALYPHSILIERKTLLFPCNLNQIRSTKVNSDIRFLLGYVGSQYERDEQVYKYINPFSFRYPEQAIFAGNWNKYPEKAARNEANFPCIRFEDRVLPKDMWKIYKFCMTSLLLCKSNYAAHGHITQRIHEVAANGVIGIGLKEQKGIDNFILHNISDAYDLIECIDYLKNLTIDKRQIILDEQIELLQPFDIKNVMIEFKKYLQG